MGFIPSHNQLKLKLMRRLISPCCLQLKHIMSEKEKRRRIGGEEAAIVDEHAERRGISSREMLEEMIRSYDGRDDELLAETRRQSEMLEALCGEVLPGSGGTGAVGSAASSEGAEGSKRVEEPAGERDVHPNDLPVNHDVELDPQARAWADEVKSRKRPGVATIRGFLNYKLADVDVIPAQFLEESMDVLDLHESSRRRYKFEYGPELDVWYPYPSRDPDFNEKAVYKRIIEAKEAGKTHNKEKVREKHPTLQSCFPNADGEELPYVEKAIFLSEAEDRDEWVQELVDRTTDYINSYGSQKAGVIYLSYLMDYAERKDVKTESWRSLVRSNWIEKKFWVDDW